MTKSTAHLTIDIDDVRKAGSVKEAIVAYCATSGDTSCGVIGPEFATSGPGSGWSVTFDATDFAARALSDEYGGRYYIDLSDGRLASRSDDDDFDDDAYTVEWTDESVIRIECPEIDDALEHPTLVAEMCRAVIDYHHPESDCGEWRKLIESIRRAAEAVEDIDLDDLPTE